MSGISSVQQSQGANSANNAPITRDHLLSAHVELLNVHQGDMGSEKAFVAVARKIAGCALGTIYEDPDGFKWVGKLGEFGGVFQNSLYSSRTLTVLELSHSATLEKVASDCYAVVSEGRFLTPVTCLSKQAVLDPFNQEHAIAQNLDIRGVKTTLRFMSKYIDGYQDFENAKAGADAIPFMEFIRRHHRPPEEILSPEGKSVPLLGTMAVLASGRMLGDPDQFGGKGKNAGFVWVRDQSGAIVAARCVKIDPGFSFTIDGSFEQTFSSINWVVNTLFQLGNSNFWLNDLRDLQIANSDRTSLIHWKELTENQQTQFLEALERISRYIQNPEVIDLLFKRDGAFDREDLDLFQTEQLEALIPKLQRWAAHQCQIFYDDLQVEHRSYIEIPQLARLFFGREALIAMLHEEYAVDQTDPVLLKVLHGRGGMGKSGLMSRFANQKREDYSLIFWLNCKSNETLFSSLLHLADVLKIPTDRAKSLTALQRKVNEALENRQDDRPWLLLYDNVDQPLDDGAMDADPLTGDLGIGTSERPAKASPFPSRGGHILITSRRKDLWEESALIDIPPMGEEEAVELLCATSGLDTSDRLLDLARRLNCHPQSMAQAGAMIAQNNMSVDDYLATLTQDEVVEQEEPLEAIRASIHQLKTSHREAFTWLTICSYLAPRNIPYATLTRWLEGRGYHEEVEYRAQAIATRLQELQLLTLDDQSQEFTMHENVREIFQEEEHGVQSVEFLRRVVDLSNEVFPLHWAALAGHEAIVHYLLEDQVEVSSLNPWDETPLHLASKVGIAAMLLDFGADVEAKDQKDRTPLILAAIDGRAEIAALLLDREADIEVKDQEGRTPLAWAAFEGHADAVALLLDRGADIETNTETDRAPLVWAAFKGHAQVVTLLLDRGADIKAKGKGYITPLHASAYHGHIEVATLLLDRGADFNARNDVGQTPLAQAAYDGHTKLVALLLDRGADISSRDNIGITPLSLAAYSGHGEVVALLLDRGADIEVKDQQGRTPLAWAANKGHTEVVALLLDREADIEVKDQQGRTPLAKAASWGQSEVAALLLDRGADIEVKDQQGRTPLAWAAFKGHAEAAALLLDRGADIEVKDQEGRTPLANAAIEGHVEVVALLLDHGAYIHAISNDSLGPLAGAALSGHGEVVALLLDHGAEIRILDSKHQRTPLAWAAFKGHTEVAALLLDREAGIKAKGRGGRTPRALLEVKDREGRTPLALAAYSGHAEVAALLLDRRADIEVKDYERRTPLALASRESHGEVVALLINRGAIIKF